MSLPEMSAMGQLIMGLVLQWVVRGPKTVPLWLAWAITGVSAVAVYVWISPGIEYAIKNDWRTVVAGFVTFLFAVRGAGATMKDIKAAPGSNTL